MRAAAGVVTNRLAQSLGGRTLAVSVDRLDYAKGLANRIQALDHLFRNHPEHRRNVIFLQVAAPSREELDAYRTMRRELDRAVGDINGRDPEPDLDGDPLHHAAAAPHHPGRLLPHRPARRGDAAA